MSGTTTTDTKSTSSKVSEWGMVIVSVIALLIFIVALLIAYLKANETLMTTLLGIAGAGYTTVVGFWLGSSYGSSKKTDMLNAPPPATPAPTPAP